MAELMGLSSSVVEQRACNLEVADLIPAWVPVLYLLEDSPVITAGKIKLTFSSSMSHMCDIVL